MRSARKRPFGIEREFGRHREIAAHIIADKRLVALGRPFHRPADAARAPGDQREFGKEAVARAEIAADLAGDDAHAFHRHAENRRQLLFLPYDSARAGVERVASACRVIDAERGARLHRHAGDAIDPGVEPGDMGGARERRVGRGGIADLGVDHDVRQVVIEPRRPRLDRGFGIGHRRQRLVIDDDALGGVLGRGNALGNHEGDRGADVTHPIGRQHMMRRDRDRGAVAVVQHDIGRVAGSGEVRNARETVGAGVLPGQDREHAGHGARFGNIDGSDQRMRVRGAQHRAIGLVRKIEIVAVAAAPGQEAQILLAAYRVSDACLHDRDGFEDVVRDTLTARLARLVLPMRSCRYAFDEDQACNGMRAESCNAASQRIFGAMRVRSR